MNKSFWITIILINFSAHGFYQLESLESDYLESFQNYSNYFRLGDHTGNGGDVIICDQGDSISYRMLDYYETSELHFLTPELPPTGSRESYLEIIIGRLDKNIQSSYRSRAESFLSRVEWTSEELQDIPDSQHTLIPSHCQLKQIAINHLNGQISINENLWKKLDDLNQAVLILHELFYEDAILSGHRDSVSSRFTLSYKISSHHSSIKIEDEVWYNLKSYNPHYYEGIIRFSPFPKVIERTLTKMLSKTTLTPELKKYLISFADSSHYDIIYSAFENTRDYSVKVNNRAFLSKYIEENIQHLSKLKSLSAMKVHTVISFINRGFNLEVAELLSQLISIFETVSLNNSDQDESSSEELLRLLQNKAPVIDNQADLLKVINTYAKYNRDGPNFIYLKLLERIPLNLAVPHSFTQEHFELMREAAQGADYIPKPSHFSFFVKRGLFTAEIVDIFKELLLTKKVVTAKWNSPIDWILLKRGLYYPLAQLLKEELKIAATYRADERVYESYYVRFPGPTEPMHSEAILKNFYANIGQDNPIRWLVLQRKDHSNKVQNALAHRIRFTKERDRVKMNSIQLLSTFKTFTPFTHSVMALKLEEDISIYPLQALLRLYKGREYPEHLKSIFTRLLKHPNQQVVTLASGLLKQ